MKLQQTRRAAAPALLGAAMLIAAAIFVADTVTQLEIAVAVLYVAVILMVVRVFERRGVLVVALACVALTILSYFLSREDSPRGLVSSIASSALPRSWLRPLSRAQEPIGDDSTS